MPIIRNYNPGSIIYFVGDTGDEVYVLQKGRIVLMSPALDYKDDVKEDVRRGEFFGVKSALGHYPREETAQVLGTTQVLVFKSSEFEQFALKNPKLVLTMLKVFSGQLRRVHKKVREILGEGELWETSAELLNIAEYYYKKGETDFAMYGFEAYLRHYPAGHFSGRAKDLLQNVKMGSPYPLNVSSLDEEISKMNTSVEAKEVPAPANDFDTSFDEEPAEDSFSGGDFEAPDLGDSFGDDGSPDDSEPDSSTQLPSSVYFEALNLFSQGNFAEAIEGFDKVLAIKSFPESELQFLEKATYDKGRALLKLRKAKPSIEVFSTFLKKYPRSEMTRKVMIQLGEIYEAMKDQQRAIMFYKKVSKMRPEDKESIAATNKLKKMGGRK